MPRHVAGKPQDPTPVPAGEWNGHIDEIRVGTRDDGNEKWSVAFKIEDEGQFFGRLLWDDLIFGLPQCAWKIDQFLAATMGAPAEGEEVDMQIENFYQLPCRVRSYVDDYQGVKKGKVKAWLPIKEDADDPTAVAPGDATKTQPIPNAAPTATGPAAVVGPAPAKTAPAQVKGKNPTF